MQGDFNLFFDQNSGSPDENPVLKNIIKTNLKSPLTCVIYGILETLIPKHLLFGKHLLYLFQAICKNWLKMLK